MITPQISSFGMLLCAKNPKAMKNHGKNGALKENNPKNVSSTSGFLLPRTYTRTLTNGGPRNIICIDGDRHRRNAAAKKSIHEKRAGDLPEASSSNRA